MPAKFILTQCVNRCLQDSTQDMSLMQVCKDSSPVRTNLENSKKRSCCTFNGWDRTAELRSFTHQELRKRLTVSMQMGFVDIATQPFIAMGCFYNYCPCQEARVALSEKDVQCGTKKRNGWNAETIHRGKTLHFWRNVGMWIVETLQDRCVSKRALGRFPSIILFNASGPVIGRNKITRIVWIPTV